MKKSKKIIAVITACAMAVMSIAGFQGKSGSAREYKGDYSSATALALDGAWSGDKYFTETTGEIWYKLVIPSDGAVNFKIMSYIGNRVYWGIFNADLSKQLKWNDVYNGTDTAPKTIDDTIVLSQGTYYLKLTCDKAGKYKTFASFTSYNVNDKAADSYDSPQAYTFGTDITGAITETDSEDWYKIIVPKDSYYTQKIVSYVPGTLYWDLYNSDLSKRAANGSTYGGSDTAPKTITDNIVLSAGTYYVKLSGGTGKYIYSFSQLTQENCDHDYTSSYVSATYFNRGYTKYTCQKCGRSYKDDYTAKKTLSQPYVSSWSYWSTKTKKLYLSWSSVSDATGYQVRYSTNKRFAGSVGTVRTKKTSKTISSLSRGKKYYLQVRAYKRIGSKTVYSKWCSKKYVKTK